jgi:hypothetical protein
VIKPSVITGAFDILKTFTVDRMNLQVSKAGRLHSFLSTSKTWSKHTGEKTGRHEKYEKTFLL